MTESIKASTEPVVWLTLVLTGILLAILLPVHVYLTHLTGAGIDAMGFDIVLGRLSSAPMKLFYFVTLVALVLHGWGGVRGVLFDIKGLQIHRHKIDVAILIIGAITLAYGSYLLIVVGK
jgi:succinate dehydrogenase membrane anchor subunit